MTRSPTDADTAKGEWEVTITAQNDDQATYTLTNMYAITFENKNTNNADNWTVELADETPEYVFAGTDLEVTIEATYADTFDDARYMDYSVNGSATTNAQSNEDTTGLQTITWTVDLGTVNSDQEIVVTYVGMSH